MACIAKSASTHLHVVDGGNDTLGGQLLDLLWLRLPLLDVGRVAQAQWATGEDDGAYVGLVRGGQDGLLVLAWRT